MVRKCHLPSWLLSLYIISNQFCNYSCIKSCNQYDWIIGWQQWDGYICMYSCKRRNSVVLKGDLLIAWLFIYKIASPVLIRSIVLRFNVTKISNDDRIHPLSFLLHLHLLLFALTIIFSVQGKCQSWREHSVFQIMYFEIDLREERGKLLVTMTHSLTAKHSMYYHNASVDRQQLSSANPHPWLVETSFMRQ
jgi:hypothetical protein